MQSDEIASEPAIAKKIGCFFSLLSGLISLASMSLLERSDSTMLSQGRAGDLWGKRMKEGTSGKKEEEREKDHSF